MSPGCCGWQHVSKFVITILAPALSCGLCPGPPALVLDLLLPAGVCPGLLAVRADAQNHLLFNFRALSQSAQYQTLEGRTVKAQPASSSQGMAPSPRLGNWLPSLTSM